MTIANAGIPAAVPTAQAPAANRPMVPRALPRPREVVLVVRSVPAGPIAAALDVLEIRPSRTGLAAAALVGSVSRVREERKMNCCV